MTDKIEQVLMILETAYPPNAAGIHSEMWAESTQYNRNVAREIAGIFNPPEQAMTARDLMKLTVEERRPYLEKATKEAAEQGMYEQPTSEPELLTDACHYAELGSPTKGRQAVLAAIQQAYETATKQFNQSLAGIKSDFERLSQEKVESARKNEREKVFHWLREYAVHGGNVPLKVVLVDMRVGESPEVK